MAVIAFPSWFWLVESRSVDSAANQLVADLRHENASATNQLTNWQVILTAGSQSYQLVKLSSPQVTTTRWLPDGTEIGTSITVRFNSDGSAVVVSGSGNTIVVRAADGNPQHSVVFNTETSRVTIAS